MSQYDQILNHLKSGKSITPLEALHLYGCFRLSARINDLRKSGYLIETINIHKDRKHYASYHLRQETADAYKIQRELSA